MGRDHESDGEGGGGYGEWGCLGEGRDLGGQVEREEEGLAAEGDPDPPPPPPRHQPPTQHRAHLRPPTHLHVGHFG